MKIYADSSFIVALYLPQTSTTKAITLMAHYKQALPFIPWHRLEVRNAIRLAVYQKVIEPAQAKQQLKQVDQDLKEATVLIHQNVDWTDVLRRAERLGASHNESIGCRSADLFHVAAALELERDVFLTLDARQATMARAAGLTVKP